MMKWQDGKTAGRIPRALQQKTSAVATMSGGVLLVGPLSDGPLTGGVENGISMILRSELASRYNIRLFNTARRHDPTRPLARRLASQLRQFARFAAEILRMRPQIVHVKVSSGLNFFQGIGYCAIGRALRRRVLLQFHGGSFDAWYQGQGRFGRLAVRAGLHIPLELIVLSAYWRSFIACLRPACSPYIVPNGVEIEHALPRSEPQRMGLRVVTLGALGRRKGHFDIVAAAARLKDEPLHFLFAGPDEFGGEQEELSTYAKTRGVLDRIEFLGGVEAQQKWQLLAESDVFLLPSYNENMPNAVLEAMAAALPVICTPVGALPDMLRDGEGAIFIPPGDPTAIARALRRLQASPNLRRTMGRQNRLTVETRFSFKRVQHMLDAIYQGKQA